MSKNLYYIIEKVSGINISKIKETSLFIDLGLDSVDIIDLLLKCEDAYKITFNDIELINIKSISDLIYALKNRGVNLDYIRKKIRK